MSLTYIGALVQFAVVLGLLNSEEANIVTEGLVAVISLATLAVTLWGRFRLGGVSVFGAKLLK